MAFFTLSNDPEVNDNPVSPTDMVSGGGDELRKDNQMSIVTSMSTADLLKYYNDHSGKPPVKRFADRKTAEKRVSDLIASKSKETEMAKKTKKAAAPKKAAAKKKTGEKKPWGGWKRAAVLYGKDHYLSLPLAFQALKLPMSRVRPARKKLKAEGTLAFEFNGKTFNFKLAPVEAQE